jgi:hypothetical protein
MANARLWVDPSNPGVLQLPADAAQHQIAIATDTCNQNTKGWNMWIKVTNKLKQQILDAMEVEGELVGHATRSISKLLNHLVTCHSQIKPNNIKNNKKKLGAGWSPTSSLKELWIHANQCRQFAAIAQVPIPDGKVLCILLDVIAATGLFSNGCKEWCKKLKVDQMHDNFKQHFQRCCDECTRVLSAQAAGFHSANAAVTEILPQANTTTTGMVAIAGME